MTVEEAKKLKPGDLVMIRWKKAATKNKDLVYEVASPPRIEGTWKAWVEVKQPCYDMGYREILTASILKRYEMESIPETYDKDYFKEAIDYWRENLGGFHHKNYTSMLTIWTHVRCLIFSHYGVHALTQMKAEWKNEANKRAIDILKMVEKGDLNENSGKTS